MGSTLHECSGLKPNGTARQCCTWMMPFPWGESGNPNYGILSFDSFYWSILAIFQARVRTACAAPPHAHRMRSTTVCAPRALRVRTSCAACALRVRCVCAACTLASSIWQGVTLEGWAYLMYAVQDGYNYYASAFFFFIVVVCGSYFVINLFIAVIYDAFMQHMAGTAEHVRGVVRGAWCVVRGAWYVVRGAWCVVSCKL